MQWCFQGPPLPPQKVMRIIWVFSLELQTTTFRAIMHPCMLNWSPPGRPKKTHVFLMKWALVPPGAAQCDQPLASNGHFWQHVLPFRPLPCSLGAVGRPSGLSNGLRCQVWAPNSLFWHLLVMCTPAVAHNLPRIWLQALLPCSLGAVSYTHLTLPTTPYV